MIDNIDASPLKKEAASRDFRTFLCRPPKSHIVFPTLPNIYANISLCHQTKVGFQRQRTAFVTNAAPRSVVIPLPPLHSTAHGRTGCPRSCRGGPVAKQISGAEDWQRCVRVTTNSPRTYGYMGGAPLVCPPGLLRVRVKSEVYSLLRGARIS